jgi:ferrous-iron efflux pump FieF
VHDLRTRRSGLATFIQFHLELDPAMPLARAHAIADAVETEILAAFPNAEIIIHQDPAGYEANAVTGAAA